MASKYLKSLVTGVVLPYNEAALKSADIRLMEPAECKEYEASVGGVAAPVEPPVVEAVAEEPVVEEPVVEEVVDEPVLEDDSEDDIDEVIAALEIE